MRVETVPLALAAAVLALLIQFAGWLSLAALCPLSRRSSYNEGGVAVLSDISAARKANLQLDSGCLHILRALTRVLPLPLLSMHSSITTPSLGWSGAVGSGCQGCTAEPHSSNKGSQQPGCNPQARMSGVQAAILQLWYGTLRPLRPPTLDDAAAHMGLARSASSFHAVLFTRLAQYVNVSYSKHTRCRALR